MTKYILILTTYKVGMKQRFEFFTKDGRMNFLQSFVNHLHDDYLLKLELGERTFAATDKERQAAKWES